MIEWLRWLFAPFLSLANLPRAVASLSMAGRIAVLVALFQILTVALAIGVLVIGNERHVIQAWWHPYKLALLGALLILAPILVYQAARLWLERESSRWPDILEAWNAALLELRHQGIPIKDVPVFLVVGGACDEEEKRILAEAPCELTVRAAPAGAAALHVYGGPDAIFICLSRTSQLAEISRRGAEAGATKDDRPEADGHAEQATKSLRLHFEMPMRLRYVCELLRHERGGLAPINGVLAILPWRFIERGEAETVAVGRSLGSDLATIGSGMGLRAPVVTLLVDTAPERGFAELIRRTPPAERRSRLGQRFPVGAVATTGQLGTVASRACGSVEDMITGRLLRAPDVLAQGDNDQLVALVSRLRHDVSARLARILQRAFTVADGDTALLPPFLSGCYLAGCGAGRDGQAFVGGVLEKLLDSQGELEWAPGVEAGDLRALRIARVLWVISVVAVVAFTTFLSRRMLWGG